LTLPTTQTRATITVNANPAGYLTRVETTTDRSDTLDR